MNKLHFSPLFLNFFLGLALNGCGGKFIDKISAVESSSSSSSVAGGSEPGARIIFSAANFTQLDQFTTSQNTSHQCLGDVLKVFYVNADDYMGGPTAFPTPSAPDTLLPTNRPAFVKNISVDITSTYYAITQTSIVATDSCSYRGISSAPNPSSCADFDRTPAAAPTPTVPPIATPSPSPLPSSTPATTQYYGSNYYRVRDDWCVSQGPVIDPDPEITKASVGGVSIDLDRAELGANEDLLMLVTYHSLNENSGTASWPANLIAGTAQTAQDHTVLKVNLVGTQQSLDTLLSVKQPRTWTYSNTSTYPVYLKEIATLEDPYGSLRTEQIYIPLSQNVLVDRIRIERIRGSYHLFQVDLYRLGNRSE